MQVRYANALFIIVVAMAAVGMLIVKIFAPPDHVSLARRYPPSPEWLSMAQSVLSSLALPKGTTWSINSPSQIKGVSIVIFDSAGHDTGNDAAFLRNCSYLGDRHTITCDVDTIRRLAEYYDLNKKELTSSAPDGRIVKRWVAAQDADMIRSSYAMLMGWIIAHELGHLLSGHAGQFYFAHHNPSSMFDTKRYCHRIEFEADSYAVKLLQASRVEDFYLFIYNLINREIAGMACPGKPKVAACDNIYPGTGLAISDTTFQYIVSGTHPDFSVRLLRIAQLAQSSADFGILAYQLNQLIATRLAVVVPSSKPDPCPY